MRDELVLLFSLLFLLRCGFGLVVLLFLCLFLCLLVSVRADITRGGNCVVLNFLLRYFCFSYLFFLSVLIYYLFCACSEVSL